MWGFHNTFSHCTHMPYWQSSGLKWSRNSKLSYFQILNADSSLFRSTKYNLIVQSSIGHFLVIIFFLVWHDASAEYNFYLNWLNYLLDVTIYFSVDYTFTKYNHTNSWWQHSSLCHLCSRNNYLNLAINTTCIIFCCVYSCLSVSMSYF